jgi:5-methylcytosine-specific restriction endonuclease McrA
MIASAMEWNRQHPEKVAAKSKAQHAKRKGNGGSYTAKQWLQLKKTYGRCVGCGLSEAAIIALGRTLAADHVLPIAKGGSSNIDNIQPLCHGRGGCNNKKAARHIDYRRTA